MMKPSNTTRFRATYSREVTSRACDPRRNLFTPVFTRPDSSTLVSELHSWRVSFLFFFGMFFSFLLCKVRDSAAWNLKPRTKKKTVQLSGGCNSVCEPQKKKRKNGQLLRLPRRFVRFISINFILSLFIRQRKRTVHFKTAHNLYLFSLQGTRWGRRSLPRFLRIMIYRKIPKISQKHQAISQS